MSQPNEVSEEVASVVADIGPGPVQVMAEGETGKTFDFTVHPDTMDPQTRGVFYRLRYRGLTEDVTEWIPDGQIWGEIAVGLVLGREAMKAAGLTVTPEMKEPLKKSDVAAKEVVKADDVATPTN